MTAARLIAPLAIRSYCDGKAAVAAMGTLLTTTMLVLQSLQAAPKIVVYTALLSAGCAITSFILWQQPNVARRVVLGVAVAAHAIALLGIPAFEDDYFRFIWDGWRTLTFGTPYGIAPDSFFGDDTIPLALASSLDGVNNPEYPTIYGPFLQITYAASFALFGTEALGLRGIFAVANLLLIYLMLKKYPSEQVALFAWNPLVIAEVALHAHPDGIMALLIFAALYYARRAPIWAGIFLGLAAATKIVALVAWPLLLRMRPQALAGAVIALSMLYAVFLVQGQGAGFDSTGTFAVLWNFNPLLFELISLLAGQNMARILVALIAGGLIVLLHARIKKWDDVPLTLMFGIILALAPAVNSWYLLWLLPFAVQGKMIWPFAVTIALPWSYVTGLNLDNETLGAFEVHMTARAMEWAIILSAASYDIWNYRAKIAVSAAFKSTPIRSQKIAIVIPALNEQDSIGAAVNGIYAAKLTGLEQLIVVDNGSTDATASIARQAGAYVIRQDERGYGAACLAGIAVLNDSINIVMFMDADGSDVPEEAANIIAPITGGTADLVIGSRRLGQMDPGAMSMPQRFGNWLAPLLVRIIWGVRYTDLGPFRAIRRDKLEQLHMADRDFGWTIEMQVRAAKLGFAVTEVPANYRKRIGISKISGTASGVFKASVKILFVIGREAFGDFDQSAARHSIRANVEKSEVRIG
jgi:Glycosyl transferase family 2